MVSPAKRATTAWAAFTTETVVGCVRIREGTMMRPRSWIVLVAALSVALAIYRVGCVRSSA